MAKIHISLSGEGRGHATRAQVLVEELAPRHRVILSAYGQALSMLRPLYAGTDVEVREIPGLRFRYDQRGRLDRVQSLLAAVPFLATMGPTVARLARELERDGTDLVISDFEPLMARAARLARVHSMSIDHQQFLLSYDLSSLPPALRRKARLLAPFTRPFYAEPASSVISAFFFPKLKHRSRPITQAGVLLRREIREARPEYGDHLVAYLRRDPPPHVLAALAASGRTVHVYGTKDVGQSGNLSFRAVDPGRFAEDLAGACALVSTAGNQVVGEALSLGKPVLSYPEPGNFEQAINAFFLERSRCGWARDLSTFSPQLVDSFLESVPSLRDRIRPERVNGNRVTLLAVAFELAAATTASIVRRPTEISPQRGLAVVPMRGLPPPSAGPV